MGLHHTIEDNAAAGAVARLLRFTTQSLPPLLLCVSFYSVGTRVFEADNTFERVWGPAGCVDKRPSDCSGWALSGECVANADYMSNNCPLSCNLCPSPPPPAGTIQPPSPPSTVPRVSTGVVWAGIAIIVGLGVLCACITAVPFFTFRKPQWVDPATETTDLALWSASEQTRGLTAARPLAPAPTSPLARVSAAASTSTCTTTRVSCSSHASSPPSSPSSRPWCSSPRPTTPARSSPRFGSRCSPPTPRASSCSPRRSTTR